MAKTSTGILLIILVLIVLALPLAGLIAVSWLTGFALALFGNWTFNIRIGWHQRKHCSRRDRDYPGNNSHNIRYGFIVSPALFAFIAGFLIYLAGIFLVIVGLIAIFAAAGARWNGVVTLIIGLIYLILGYFVSDPFYLGVLIGLWLLIVGIMNVLQKED